MTERTTDGGSAAGLRPASLDQAIVALSLAGLGALSLLSGDFALNWQPVPAWVLWRHGLAYASGLVLCASALGTLVRRTAPLASRVLAVYLLLWLVLLRATRVAADPASEGMWLGFGENLVLLTGGWVLLATVAAGEGATSTLTGAAGVRAAQFAFGLALPIIGLSHFVYVKDTAALVPAWLPARTALAYLTGAAHIAAGLGVLLSIVPRLAATLEAAMLASFTLLVWAPRLVQTPGSRFEWTAFLVSAAIAAATAIVARSFDSRAPLARRSSAAALAGCLALFAVPSTSTAAPRDLVPAFQALEQSLMDAVAAGDKRVWDRAMDDGCVITSEEGRLSSKVEFLNELQALPPGLTGRIAVRDLTVQAFPDFAVVRYLADESEQVFGQRLATKYRTTDTFRRDGADWKLVASHTAVVTADPPAQPADRSHWGSLTGTYQLAPDGWTFHVELRKFEPLVWTRIDSRKGVAR